ncbi:MAG: alpha/beta hydrolase [Muribaculaceae bacterium]|nr:alpha/beta hydrolase [Muribaculaceae bacterium]
MKNRGLLFALLILCSVISYAADFVGHWKGTVANLPIVFHISNDSIWRVSLDSPQQGAFDIPCGTVAVEGDIILIDMPALRANFKGVMAQDDKSINGTFTQGMAIPIVLTRTTKEASRLNRPQEPQPPFVYHSQEVTFNNGDITLAGTFTKPIIGSKHKAVVLVSGSGAQNRDEELFGHKPFAVIADYLTRHGIAVLRYDDRGVGGSSKGSDDATTLDLATDAMAAVDYLKSRNDIDTTHIGIIGHSEGGLIAVINAATHPNDVDFIVTLAGPYVKGKDILIKQNHLASEMAGMPLSESQAADVKVIFETIDASTDSTLLAADLRKIMSATGNHSEQEIEQTIKVMASPWYVAFVKLDPAKYLPQVKCPVLAMNGSWDFQVDATQNLGAARKALPHATVKEYEGLNHLFQPSSSRQASMSYGAIEITISEQVLKDIVEWINSQK